jgi:hypothetical protein
MAVLTLEKSDSVPLTIDDAPDVLLFLLHVFKQLYLIVEIFYCCEVVVIHLNASAYLAVTVLLHLDMKRLPAFGRLYACNQVHRKHSAHFDGLKSCHQPVPIEVNSCAVRVAFVLEVEHFLPYSITVILWSLV